MNFRFTRSFAKSYQRLPIKIRRKADRQIRRLTADFYYPSLRTKKMAGKGLWEFRIDRSYRMTGEKQNGDFILRTIGSHDEGLGKK
jgi:mRNA-degrading endonuclease RelE of RelBE toxin-antitoxin system